MLICLGFYTVQAQQAFQLSGKITDTAGVALSHATISIITPQDTLISLTLDDGNFVVNNLKAIKFKLWVTMKGYLPFTKSYFVTIEKRNVKLETIALKADYNELDPVTISRVRPITFQEDTISYHVATFLVRDGSEVADILKRLPGIEVDVDGNVIVQGKKVQKVTVNGKDFFGGDVLLAIRNLPADVVDKLQVIDDYGDKARLTGIKSGESVKVLNIVMKSDKRNGEFGHIETGAGDYDKYSGEVFGNAFKGDKQVSANAGLSNTSPTGNNPAYTGRFNYADQWNLRWNGSVNYNNEGQHSQSSGSSIQDNFYSGELLRQFQTSQNSNKSSNNGMAAMLTYKPNSYSMMKFTTVANDQSSTSQSSSNFSILQQGSGFTKSTMGSNRTESQSNEQSVNSNLYYEKLSTRSKQRFNAELALNYSRNHQNTDNQSNATISTDSSSSSSLLHYLVTNTTPTVGINFNSTYFLPLGATSFLNLGYTGQSSYSQTTLLTQHPGFTSGPLVIVDSLSQHQVYRTLTQNIHIGFSGHFHKLDLMTSLDGQPGMMKGSTSEKGNTTSYYYFFPIPRLEGSWIFDKSRKVKLTYNSQPNLPGLAQLTPFTNVTNPQYPVTGNANLKPSYTNNLSIHYEQYSLHPTQYSGFGVSLSYTSTEHSIISNITNPKDNSQVIQQTTYVNAGTTSNLYADYYINFPSFFNRRFRINTRGGYSLAQTPIMTDGLLYNNQNRIWNQSLHLQLLIPDVIETDVEGNYSVTHSEYPGSGSLPNTFKTASIFWNTKQYFFKNWILSYKLSQPYTSSGSGLHQAPSIMSASLQRQFLRHNKATISVNGYNLLNSAAGIGQSTSPTGVTQSTTQYIGRYIFCTFMLKLNRFSN